MIAVVRVRGLIGREKSIEATLRMLHLYKKNHCTILEASPTIMGMVRKVKDFVTWGELDEETGKILKQKSKASYVRLDSPRKGYGRKGIKNSFTVGGALGDRKEKINDLLKRML